MKLSQNLTFLFLAFFVLVGCSRKEDPLPPDQSPFSIELSSNQGTTAAQVIAVNEEMVFAVTGSDGQDYTASSSILVDGQTIEGSTYLFDNSGLHLIQATYEGIESNVLEVEVLMPTARALSVSVGQALRNQDVVFSLLDSEGIDTAEEAIFFVNGNEISGSSFSSATAGEFEVYANYEIDGETYESESKTFKVFIPKRKVVIEDYTGTWCGYCPAVALAIENVRAVTSDVAVVTIHKQGASLPDPLDFARIGDMQNMFGVSNAFPQGQINRLDKWVDPYAVTDVTAMAGQETDVSIAIHSRVSGSSLTVDVQVVYEQGAAAGDKLVVYLLENDVVAAQANYYNEFPGHPYEGLGNPIPNYVHNDGLRKPLSDLFGDPIAQVAAFERFEKQFTTEIPSEYVAENLSFVVMVVDANNKAKNAQYAKINENKQFE